MLLHSTIFLNLAFKTRENKQSMRGTQEMGYALKCLHRNEKYPKNEKDTNLYIRLEVKEVYSLPIASIQS